MTKKTETRTDNRKETQKELRNEDPLSGQAGAHPVGTGVGAALGGAAAGAVAGAVAGPIGTVVGAVAGAVAGGYGGKAVAESIDPTVETEYWRDNYQSRDYYNAQYGYEVYEPAYRMGWEKFDQNYRFEDRENDLRKYWESNHANTGLDWNNARRATRDAWERTAGRFTQKSNLTEDDRARRAK